MSTIQKLSADQIAELIGSSVEQVEATSEACAALAPRLRRLIVEIGEVFGAVRDLESSMSYPDVADVFQELTLIDQINESTGADEVFDLLSIVHSLSEMLTYGSSGFSTNLEEHAARWNIELPDWCA